MRARPTNLLALAVMAVGLLLGPGYLAYGWFLSGSTVGTHRLSTAHPLTLRLSPEMNRIRFVVAATFMSHSQRDKTYDYHAVLARDAATIWEERFSVTRPSKTDDSSDKGFGIRIFPKSAELMSPLRTFSVDRAGEFSFTVRPWPHPRPQPGVRLHLHVRRNVLSPNLAMVIPGFLLALVGAGWWLATKRPRSARQHRAAPARPKSSPVGRAPQENAAPVSTADFPYRIDSRPMPEGEDVNALLPAQVGPYTRDPIDEPVDTDEPIYATYRRTGGSSVFVELGICEDGTGAQGALETANAETDAEFPDAPRLFLRQGDVWCLRTVNRLGAFIAWTRGPYYFSAHAKGGEKDLDEFMVAFSY